MNQERPQRYSEHDTDLERSKLQLILVSLLVFILFWGIVEILAEILPEWNWRILPLLVALVALESAWTTRWIKRAPPGVNRTLYRLAETTVILIFTVIVYVLGYEIEARKELIDSFLDSSFLIVNSSLLFWMAICFLAWRWSSVLTGIFNELVISNDEVLYFTTPSSERRQKGIPQVVPVFRRRLYHSFIRNWVTGGVLLAGLAMLATIEFSSSNLESIQTLEFRNVTRLGMRPEFLVALLVYFGAGFWLASHARMALMQARWIAGGHTVEAAVILRWRHQVVVVIAIVAILAAFLPIGSSLAISRIIRATLNLLVAISASILASITAAFAWVLSFLPSASPPREVEPALPIEPALPQAEVDALNLELPPFILEAIFLGMAIVVTILAFIYFFKFRYQHFNLTMLVEIWRSFKTLVKGTWLSVTNKSRELATAVKASNRLPKTLEKIPRMLSFSVPVRARARTPTQKVRSYYLWLIEHAARQGVCRQESDTPLEYERLVVENWPEIAADFRGLTRLFIQARYNIPPLSHDDARQAESIAKRLHGQIRRHLRMKTSLPDG